MPTSPWGLTAQGLAALRPPIDAAVLQARLIRAALGRSDAPALGRAARAFADSNLDERLPQIVSRSRSEDGSDKLVFSLDDGARVEAVRIPRAVRNPRVTVCVSSQVGCAMGCTFCHTATMGLVRNLQAHEIVGQLLAVMRAFGDGDGTRMNVVFMGMGEPLHNVEAVLAAVAAMCDPAGLGMSPGRITVSTSGLLPGLERLIEAEIRPAIALSVNATTDAARERIMPIGRAHRLADLRQALARVPLRSHEKITLEYVLLANENDTDEDAARLAEFARGFRNHVNVIPYNAFPGAPFMPPSEDRLARFVQIARDGGALVTVRRSRGRDVAAACGQLVQEGRLRRSR